MNKKSFAVTTSAAILGLISGMNSTSAEAHTMVVPAGKEQCYGIAKAGKNDCGWSGGSCAGTAKREADREAWILVPTGLCNKISGASLKPGVNPPSFYETTRVPGVQRPRTPVVTPPKPEVPTTEPVETKKKFF